MGKRMTRMLCSVEMVIKIEIRHDNKTSWIVLDQIRTIDKRRIIKISDTLTPLESEKVKQVIRELLVD